MARPKLSADGTLLAWTSRRHGEPEVFLMPVAGGTPRQLTFFGAAAPTCWASARTAGCWSCRPGSQPFRSCWWAYAIDVADGADPTPRRLPYGPVTAVAMGDPAVVVSTG